MLRLFCESMVIVTLVNWEGSRKINSQTSVGFVLLQKILSKSMFLPKLFPKMCGHPPLRVSRFLPVTWAPGIGHEEMSGNSFTVERRSMSFFSGDLLMFCICHHRGAL